MTQTDLRPDITRHLRQRLEAFRDGFRQNLALIGPPGSGKTFQLHQLLANPPAHLVLLYCPLYRESCRSFLHRFASIILHAGVARASQASASSPTEPLERQGSSGHAGTLPLEALLDRVAAHLPNTAMALRPIEGLLARRLYSEALNRTLDAIPILSEERGQSSVLILDEFLFLEELGLGHAFHELGKRVMTWPATLFILSSSSPFRARAILRERLQLLFGQFELITLETLEPRGTAAWVQQELRGLRGAKTLSAFLVQWLGAYPWYLAVFLKRLRELATLRKTSELTEALFFQTAWDVLGSSEGILHQWSLSRTDALTHDRQGARALEAVLHIATGGRTTTEIGKRMGRADLSGALQLLVEHDLVERKGTCWFIPDPLLRCWLAAVLMAQRSGAGLSAAATRSRFEQYLAAAWAQWLQASQLSFPERVARLFSCFSDDTVSLDSKTGRLPRFQTVTTQRPSPQGGAVYLLAEGEGKRWCASVQEGLVDENAIARFDAFCRAQTLKPSRKVVITQAGVDANGRLLAKANNMWVWTADDLEVLRELYGPVGVR